MFKLMLSFLALFSYGLNAQDAGVCDANLDGMPVSTTLEGSTSKMYNFSLQGQNIETVLRSYRLYPIEKGVYSQEDLAAICENQSLENSAAWYNAIKTYAGDLITVETNRFATGEDALACYDICAECSGFKQSSYVQYIELSTGSSVISVFNPSGEIQKGVANQGLDVYWSDKNPQLNYEIRIIKDLGDGFAKEVLQTVQLGPKSAPGIDGYYTRSNGNFQFHLTLSNHEFRTDGELNYRLQYRVEVYPAGNYLLKGISNFKVIDEKPEQCTINFTSPSSGATIARGENTRLSWDTYGNPAFDLWVSRADDGTNQKIDPSGLYYEKFVDTPLGQWPAGSYKIWLRAASCSSWSSQLRFTVSDGQRPAQPQIVVPEYYHKALVNNLGRLNVDVAYKESGLLYKVLVNNGPATQLTGDIGWVSASQLPISLEGLDLNQEYKISMIAAPTDHPTLTSEPSVAKTILFPKPQIIAPAANEMISSQRFRIIWDEVPYADSYQVYISTANVASINLTPFLTVTTPHADVSYLALVTSIFTENFAVWVKAKDQFGRESVWSARRDFKVNFDYFNNRCSVEILRPQLQENVASDPVNLRWEGVATSYDLYLQDRTADGRPYVISSNTRTVNDKKYVLDQGSLKESHQYKWGVKPLPSDGGAPCETYAYGFFYYKKPEPRDPPVLVSPSGTINASQARIVWTQESKAGLKEYQIRIQKIKDAVIMKSDPIRIDVVTAQSGRDANHTSSTTNDAQVLKIQDPGNELFYTLYNLQEGVKYTVRARAVYNDGFVTAYSSPMSFTVERSEDPPPTLKPSISFPRQTDRPFPAFNAQWNGKAVIYGVEIFKGASKVYDTTSNSKQLYIPEGVLQYSTTYTLWVFDYADRNYYDYQKFTTRDKVENPPPPESDPSKTGTGGSTDGGSGGGSDPGDSCQTDEHGLNICN